jgi:hypothetical protein
MELPGRPNIRHLRSQAKTLLRFGASHCHTDVGAFVRRGVRLLLFGIGRCILDR